MDTIKDFFSELKDRASNPLIASFAISWLFVNWPITIGLLFYSQEDLKLDGIKSYKDLIVSHSNIWNTTLIPIGLALIYTLLFPYVKSWIKLLHARISVKNESDILKATSEGMMPVKKYIELRDSQYETTKELRNLIESQSTIHEENNRLLTERAETSIAVNALTAQNHELTNRLKKYDSLKDISLLNGEWLFQRTQLDGNILKEEWSISAGQIIVKNNIKYYAIANMVSHPVSRLIAIRIEIMDNDVARTGMDYWFSFDEGFNTLKGLRDKNLLLVRKGFKDISNHFSTAA